MPRIAPLTLESASATRRPLLEEAVTLAGGRLLNLHATMASSAAVLGSYLGTRRAVAEHRPLDARIGAAIMLAVAAVDDSEYALAVTTVVGTRAGWTPAETIALRSGLAADPGLTALLAVARQAAASSGHVEDTTWEAARAAGWSDEQLADAFAYIGQAMYVDAFANYTGIELDVPAAPPAAVG